MSKHQIVNIVFGGLSTVYALGYVLFHWPFIYYILILVLWLVLIVYGSLNIGYNYHLKAITNFSTDKKLVAITFDDGPTEVTLDVLKLFKKYGFKASFFCIGENIKRHPNIVNEILHNGHTLGNHSFTHSNIGFQTISEFIKEVNQTDDLIQKITGERPKFYRPPFGVTTPNIRKTLQQTLHQVIGWNIRSLDTIKDDEKKILDRIVKKIKPGSIILLHDTSQKSVRILEQLLAYLNQNNYRSISIEEMVNLDL